MTVSKGSLSSLPHREGLTNHLGYNSIKSYFFGIEEKREASLPVHPGCHFQRPWRTPLLTSKDSSQNFLT